MDGMEHEVRQMSSEGRPAVSIGLPVCNGEAFLRQAIDSVLCQDFPDFELVICDNVSSDATDAICRDYAQRDRRIRYYRNTRNIGAARNFCRVFELSTGRYFRWLAADDFMSPNMLRSCKAVLDARPEVVLCTGRAEIVDDKGQRICDYTEAQAIEQDAPVDRFRTALLQDPWCNAIYGLMRRDVLARTSLMGNFASSDAVLLAVLAMHGRFAEVPEVLLSRRFHANAYSYEPKTIGWLRRSGVEVDEDARASKPAAERIKDFYSPQSQSSSWSLATTRHVWEYARGPSRAAIPWRQKLAVWGAIARIGWWRRDSLVREIIGLARRPTLRSS
jgi:glycosyltransferase involved in cell wall biosynthesis